VSAYRKFSDTLRCETFPIDPPKARDLLGVPTLGGLGAASSKNENWIHTDVGGATIIAPVNLVDRSVFSPDEPTLAEPWPERRGRIERRGGALLHFCAVCGAWGTYGFGVSLRTSNSGKWFCAAHRDGGRSALKPEREGPKTK
jgi:hypothetical protein